MAEDITCSNCKNPIHKNYCPECGQKKSNAPLSLFSLFKNSFVVFVDVERSVFSLFYQILLKPKKIIQNYWSGFSRYYPGPSKLFLYALAIVALHFQFFDSRILGMQLTHADHIKSEYAFFCLLFPLLFISSFLSFKRCKDYTARQVSSFTYISSTLIIVYLLLDDFARIVFSNLYDGKAPIVILFFILSVFLWQSRVFTENSKKQIVFTLLIQFFIFIAILVILFLLLILIVPDSMKITE